MKSEDEIYDHLLKVDFMTKIIKLFLDIDTEKKTTAEDCIEFCRAAIVPVMNETGDVYDEVMARGMIEAIYAELRPH